MRITEKGGRNVFSRLFHAKNDKEMIGAWKLDLIKILHIFNVRSVGSYPPSLTSPLQTQLTVNTNAMVSDIHRSVVAGQGGTDGQYRSVSTTSYRSTTTYSPPPRPKPG